MSDLRLLLLLISGRKLCLVRECAFFHKRSCLTILFHVKSENAGILAQLISFLSLPVFKRGGGRGEVQNLKLQKKHEVHSECVVCRCKAKIHVVLVSKNKGCKHWPHCFAKGNVLSVESSKLHASAGSSTMTSGQIGCLDIRRIHHKNAQIQKAGFTRND